MPITAWNGGNVDLTVFYLPTLLMVAGIAEFDF